MNSSPVSGNEWYCLNKQGLSAGKQILASHFYSLSYLKTSLAGFKTTLGKELKSATEKSAEGWELAYNRMQKELASFPGASLLGLHAYPQQQGNFIELLFSGFLIFSEKEAEFPFFSSSADGQQWYAYEDAGYQSRQFVWGSTVYATGLSSSFWQGLKALKQGEIAEYSLLLQKAREGAFRRLKEKAKTLKANAIYGIKFLFLPYGNACEMLITGTASWHEQADSSLDILSSELDGLETWNLAKAGFMPLALVQSTTVYSLGLRSSSAGLKSFFKGEIPELAALMQEGRLKVLSKLEEAGKKIGADEVISVKIFTQQLGNGLIDFFAVGTAIKKTPGIKTRSEMLPMEVMQTAEASVYQGMENIQSGSVSTVLLRMGLIIFIIAFLIGLAKLSH